MNLNKVILIGNLTKDPVLEYTPAGDAVVNFVIATNRRYVSNGQKKEEASFIGCVAWVKLAEFISAYFKKGDPIFIEGRLHQDTWEDKEGRKQTKMIVSVENAQFVRPKKETDAPQEG